MLDLNLQDRKYTINERIDYIPERHYDTEYARIVENVWIPISNQHILLSPLTRVGYFLGQDDTNKYHILRPSPLSKGTSWEVLQDSAIVKVRTRQKVTNLDGLIFINDITLPAYIDKGFGFLYGYYFSLDIRLTHRMINLFERSCGKAKFGIVHSDKHRIIIDRDNTPYFIMGRSTVAYRIPHILKKFSGE